MLNLIKIVLLQPYINMFNLLKSYNVFKYIEMYMLLSLILPVGCIIMYIFMWMGEVDMSGWNSFSDVLFDYYVGGWRWHLVSCIVLYVVLNIFED